MIARGILRAEVNFCLFVCLIIVYFIPCGEELSIFTYRQGTAMENKFLRGCERIHGARTNWRQEMMKFKE